MWIALGIIGVMWVVGAAINPDKNGPSVFSHAKPAATASQAAATPATPPRQR
jgi:hypothetical protein